MIHPSDGHCIGIAPAGPLWRSEDIARLSPLKFAHINFHGRYSFALPAEVAGGQLRSTRKPADATASN